jgi:hypothetical protein
MRVGLLALWSGIFVVALVGWTQARYPQGRLLFPAMPAISILCVLGLAQWLPKPYARTAITVLLALLAGFAALVPHRYIAPAYARAEPLSEAERAAIANPMSVAFGGQVCLLGYDLVEATLRPGTTLWLTVYWQGLTTMERDYSVFVHLVDARGVIVSQRDSYPGSGNDPTRGWTPGRAMRDHFPLQVPLALLAQGPLRIRLGLYEFATGQRLSIVHSAEEATDFVELPVALSSQGLAPPVLTDLDLEFGGVIALTGYSVEPLTIQPGDQLRVSLRWQAREDVNEDYTVFAQLLREGDQIWGQYDHVPGDGQSPTSKWDGGLAVMDEFALPVFPGAPQDTYELIVGLYRSTTVERLRLADGTDRAVLGRIVVKHE